MLLFVLPPSSTSPLSSPTKKSYARNVFSRTHARKKSLRNPCAVLLLLLLLLLCLPQHPGFSNIFMCWAHLKFVVHATLEVVKYIFFENAFFTHPHKIFQGFSRRRWPLLWRCCCKRLSGRMKYSVERPLDESNGEELFFSQKESHTCVILSFPFSSTTLSRMKK